MIAKDVQNLRLQLIQIANNQGKAITLGRADSEILIQALSGIEERVLNLEIAAIPENFKRSLNLNECDDTNVILFPFYKNHNEGDVA